MAAAKKRGEMEKETKEVAKVEDAEAEKVMMEEEDGEAEVEKANK